MTGSRSPCGACKFLRRKCVKGCVFAPYFSYEQGAVHFGAIHKVFGASNVSKLLSHLSINERSDAAVTISYEAQARLHDPIYGCVSHIFELQHQVVSLRSQLDSLRHQASQSFPIGSIANPNYNHHDSSTLYQSGNPSFNHINQSNHLNFSNPNGRLDQLNQINDVFMNMRNSSIDNNYNYGTLGNNDMSSFGSFDETSEQSFGSNNFDDDLQSVAFGFFPNS